MNHDARGDGGDLDPAVRRILYGEDEDAAPPPASAETERVRRAPAGEELDIALDAGSVVLAAAISDERRAAHFDGSWEERIIPIGRGPQVRDAIAALGLPVDDREPPPHRAPRIRTVPAEALWNGPGQPSKLLGAVCEALTDPAMMELVARAVELVRFGAPAAGGERAAVAHNVDVAPSGAPPGAAMRLLAAGADGQTAEVSCPCGFSSGGPIPAREALTRAAVHVRLEIETRLRLLSIAAMRERASAVGTAERLLAGDGDGGGDGGGQEEIPS